MPAFSEHCSPTKAHCKPKRALDINLLHISTELDWRSGRAKGGRTHIEGVIEDLATDVSISAASCQVACALHATDPPWHMGRPQSGSADLTSWM